MDIRAENLRLEPFSAAFGFRGRQADLLDADGGKDAELAAELNDCLEHADTICFLVLFLDASAIDRTSPTHGLYFLRSTTGTSASIESIRKTTEEIICIRHESFRSGLPTMANILAPTSGAGQVEQEQVQYSFLCADVPAPEPSHEKPIDAGAPLALTRVKMDTILYDPHTSSKQRHDDKSLEQGWKSWQDVISGQRLTDRHGRHLRSLYSLPTCVTAESLAGAVVSPPMANIILGLSTPVCDRASFKLLSDLHHWLCYRQFSSLLISNTARIYNQVVDHVAHELGRTSKVVEELVAKGYITNADDFSTVYQNLTSAANMWQKSGTSPTNWGNLVDNVIDAAVPAAYVRVSYDDEKWYSELVQCLHISQVERDQAAGLTYRVNYGSLENQNPREYFHGNGLAMLQRVLFAAIRNGIEHLLRRPIGTMGRTLDLKLDVEGELFIASISNPCDTQSKVSDARVGGGKVADLFRAGTKEVIAFSLMTLGGRVTHYGRDKAKDADGGVWTTSFVVPLRGDKS